MSSPTSLLRVLATLALIVAAFLAGRLTRPPSSSVDGTAARVSPASAGIAGHPNVPLSAPSTDSPDSAAPALAEFSARAARQPQSLSQDDERQKTLEQWAGRDPAGAIDFARTHLKGDRQAQALSSILAIWGKNDPAGAWAWVGKNMPTATHHYDTLLEAFGKTSPVTAARYASELVQQHPEAALEVNLAVLLGITYTGDFSAARLFVDQNAALPPEIRGNLNNFIAGQWARYAPKDAAAWTMSLPAGPLRDQALVGLGESWAGVDPAAAAQFATSLPAGESRQLALRQAITGWLETDAEQARHWVLETNHHEDYDQAVAAVATQNNFMFREPDRALQWTGTIFDDNLRLRSTATILSGLYTRDPVNTVAYIRTMPDLTASQRAELLTQFPPKE